MSVEFLRRLPLFAGLNEEDLKRLHDMATPVSIRTGEVLMEEGTMGNSLYVLLEGKFEVTKRSGQKSVVLAQRGPGEVFGEMALLDEAPRSATLTAVEDSQLLEINRSAFLTILQTSPPATLAILHTFASRIRNTEAMLRQHEKMAALGTLSAGLAHELNNPAAALERATGQLSEAQEKWQGVSLEVARAITEGDQLDALNWLQDEGSSRSSQKRILDPITRSDQEAEMEAWLEDAGAEDAWELSPSLVEAGWDVSALKEPIERFDPGQRPLILRWLAAASSVRGLLAELQEGSSRISNIVRSVKTYSYLDQAPIQQVDLHQGLEDTLTLLRHKLEPGIRVQREYAADLPRIEGYGSELNQVWTNLIDNAADALEGKGQIKVRTRVEEDTVVVEVCDDGPGIPPEIQQRIFDPFFTTKPPGVGTGLGLHITYNIVVFKHYGEIRVDSTPGSTCFSVTLPLILPREEGPPHAEG